MEQSIIYVITKSGKPLMPTKRHNKVWYWLRKSLAKVVSREPFTIQLCFETAEHVQPATVGVDTGSKHVGVAATTNGAVVYQAEVHLRTDITDKMTQRRQYRRSRRGRKTRYRQPRFANRRRQAGRLPPTLRSKAEATVKAVRFVSSILPVRWVTAKGVMGYIGGRRLKGAFVLKDVMTGKTILEVVPSKLQRIARCRQGWIASPVVWNEKESEGGASSPA